MKKNTYFAKENGEQNYKFLGPEENTCMFLRIHSRSNYGLRGDRFNLTLPINLTCNGKKSFSSMISQLWNKLPLKVRQAANLNDFKQNLMNVDL